MLLAAGAGRRAGGPKALRREPNGTSWLLRSVEALLGGGCLDVVVVLGCAADQARELLTVDPSGSTALLGSPAADQLRHLDARNILDRLKVVEAVDWAEGMSRSLQAGLVAAQRSQPSAVLIHLVDLPDVGSAVVRRVLARESMGGGVLARAAYSGQPGHPVLVGADRLAPLVAELSGVAGPHADRGAQRYLARQHPVLVECGDLASGRDQDAPT